MQRDLKTLAQEKFDLLVVGGGIYGATLAWDAVLRGLKVALIEKTDFASGTSSNSLKIIHGGLRYLQHADFVRMRESITERRILLKIAPHLVQPLPCVMPTFGHAIKGPEVMRIGLLMNDLFSFDRNRHLDKQRRLPNGRILSKQKLLDIVPYLERDDLNGGALWYDAQMTNSERLLLSFVHSAVERGAVAANYVKAESLLMRNSHVQGVKARDMLSENTFDIRATLTISTQGPWINDMLADVRGRKEPIAYSTAINLVVNRNFSETHAFAAPTATEFKDKDAIISKGSRMLFFVPWRGLTLAGTAHKPYFGDAEAYTVSESEIADFLLEVNSALPGAHIERDEIIHTYAGLLPMTGVNQESGDVQLQKHFKIIDHKKQDQLDGLMSVLTVKYTTARGVSELAVNQALEKLGKPAMKTQSRETPIWGGDIDDVESFLRDNLTNLNHGMGETSKSHLLETYGTSYRDVLNVESRGASRFETITSDSNILQAEIRFAVRHEMAQKLTDVMMRRIELGTAGKASDATIRAVANVMAEELGWDETKVQQEIQDYLNVYNVKH